jgi:hypothetical protein
VGRDRRLGAEPGEGAPLLVQDEVGEGGLGADEGRAKELDGRRAGGAQAVEDQGLAADSEEVAEGPGAAGSAHGGAAKERGIVRVRGHGGEG